MTLALLITAVTGAWAEGLSETITTATQNKYTYTGEHFKIECGVCTGDGCWLGYVGNYSVTITPLADEKITKVEMVVGKVSGTIVSSTGTISGSNSVGSTLTLNDVDATTITLSRSGGGKYEYAALKSFTIYYEKPLATLAADGLSATMTMPASDVTVTYELVRDIATGVKALVNNGAECIYVTKVEDKFVPKEAITYKLTDVLDQNNQFDLVEGTDYEKVGMHILDGYTWKDVTDESDLKPGTYEIIFKGLGKYDGNVYSQEFLLSNGYELTIAAGEYATFYHNEALYVEDEDAVLYTIASVTDTEAVLSDAIEVAPAETPLLVYNKSEQAKTFLLIPTAEPDLALTVADAFKGTLDAKKFSKDDMEAAVYYVCTGKAFAPVKSAGTIAANRCWLEISMAAPSNARKIVHGDATKITNTDRTDLTDGDLYDLNGRKVLNPTKKGIYIKNGKKVVIK